MHKSIAVCLLILWSLIDAHYHGKKAEVSVMLVVEHMRNGVLKTIEHSVQGLYSPLGSSYNTFGAFLQIHPVELCKGVNNYPNLQGFIVLISLQEQNSQKCGSFISKARRAFKRDALAVIFDVTRNSFASSQLLSESNILKKFKKPIVILQRNEAEKITSYINKYPMSSAKISLESFEDLTETYPNYDSPTVLPTNQFEVGDKDSLFPAAARGYMSIFLALFLAIITILLLIIIKMKWCKRNPETNVNLMAKRALSQMETKHFKAISDYSNRRGSNKSSIDSSNCSCAICLEIYEDGEELRVLPCGHEFHKLCVDPWLLSNQTCPLCVYDIIEGPNLVFAKVHRNAEEMPMIPDSPHFNNMVVPGCTSSLSHMPYDSGSVVYDTAHESQVDVIIRDPKVHARLLQSQSCNAFCDPPSDRSSMPPSFHRMFTSCSGTIDRNHRNFLDSQHSLIPFKINLPNSNGLVTVPNFYSSTSSSNSSECSVNGHDRASSSCVSNQSNIDCCYQKSKFCSSHDISQTEECSNSYLNSSNNLDSFCSSENEEFLDESQHSVICEVSNDTSQ